MGLHLHYYIHKKYFNALPVTNDQTVSTSERLTHIDVPFHAFIKNEEPLLLLLLCISVFNSAEYHACIKLQEIGQLTP
jgi:hypothetical protein